MFGRNSSRHQAKLVVGVFLLHSDKVGERSPSKSDRLHRLRDIELKTPVGEAGGQGKLKESTS